MMLPIRPNQARSVLRETVSSSELRSLSERVFSQPAYFSGFALSQALRVQDAIAEMKVKQIRGWESVSEECSGY